MYNIQSSHTTFWQTVRKKINCHLKNQALTRDFPTKNSAGIKCKMRLIYKEPTTFCGGRHCGRYILFSSILTRPLQVTGPLPVAAL
jgi:hypothetical protein